MSGPNYESRWWGYIYDQMMTQGLPDLLANHRRFYRTSLENVSGPVLECACGTGLILLPLLEAGHDMHGFDISTAMLDTLRSKPEAAAFEDLDRRISVQALESFGYERQFDAIIIPSNSFSMLSTQEAQISVLESVYDHLAPGGTFLLDLALAGMRMLVENPGGIEGRWHSWVHPETGRPIRQRVVSRFDFNEQRVLDRCFIVYEDHAEDFPMTSRWIFKEEFQLLLRLAGFERWEVFGTPDREPLDLGLEGAHSYWVVPKP